MGENPFEWATVAGMIRNDGEYWRTGRVISTAFVESLVNSFLSKRFVKKQQMP